MLQMMPYPTSNSNKTLLEVMVALTHNPSDSDLICEAKEYSEKDWQQPIEDGENKGVTQLWLLTAALIYNPGISELIELAKEVEIKIPKEAWKKPIPKGEWQGDTLLRAIMRALVRNSSRPQMRTLVGLIINLEIDDAEAWLKKITGTTRLKGICPLWELKVALEISYHSARADLARLGIAVITCIRIKEERSKVLITLFDNQLETSNLLKSLLLCAKELPAPDLDSINGIDSLLWLYRKVHLQAPSKLRVTFWHDKEYTNLIDRLADKDRTLTSATLSR